MEETKQPIGVFDSGIGGLTVLEQLIKMSPNEDFIYVADQGHCPYGTKTPEQIGERVAKVTKYLLSRNVKAIVIACNTASVRISSATALTDKPVISVIQPTCRKAMDISKNKTIAVLATISTIQSGTYQSIIENGGGKCVPLACSEFVDFLENNALSDPSGDAIVKEKLSAIKDMGMDTVIHGCTHFSLLEPRMRKVLGGVNYVACGEPTGERLGEILKEKNLLSRGGSESKVEIYTTGDVGAASQSMSWFKAVREPIKKVVIE